MKFAALFTLSLISATAETSWVTVRDAREQAFSINVAKGWTAKGGMFRLGPMDPRPVVDLTSADGKAHIRIGDATIPAYSLPSPYMERYGWTEGKVMPVLGSWPVIARFRPADEFLAKYGPAHFGQMCQSVATKQITATPPRIITKPYPGGRNTAAEGYFVCSVKGEPMLGYLYAETWTTPQLPGGLWAVGEIGGFLAPLTEAKATGELLSEMWKTMAYNPAWVKAQMDLSNAIARQSTRDLQRNLAESQARFEQTMHAMHQQAEELNDVLTGVTLTRDTTTGQVRYVPTGTGGRHWMNGQGTVVEGSFSPGLGYHEMQTIPHN